MTDRVPSGPSDTENGPDLVRCVMIVSCALAKDFEAVVSYGGEPPEPLETMLESIPIILKESAGEKLPDLKVMASAGNAVSKKPWWKLW